MPMGTGAGFLSVIGQSVSTTCFGVTNLLEIDAALALYKKRYRTLTIFNDYKNRGFGLQNLHLSSPEWLHRLLIACALAYWWLTYLGVTAHKREWDKVITRQDRYDLSFFQLG